MSNPQLFTEPTGCLRSGDMAQDRAACDRGLVAAATRLPLPSADQVQRFVALAQGLAEELTRNLSALPDLEDRLIGQGNRQMMADNHLNHFRFLSAYLANPDPADLVSTAQWALRTYIAHGFRPDYWRVMLPAAVEILSQRLPSDMSEAILPYYRFLSDNLESLLPAPGEKPEGGADELDGLSPLASRYVELLLAGDRRQASRLIMGQAAGGMSVRDIYLGVFSPAQRRLGQLWQENRISVAMEHFSTAATQMVMSQLFPYIFAQGTGQTRLGAGFVGCCVQGELHEIGMRMVCDLLEIEGVDTWYLGANTPDGAVLSFLADKLGSGGGPLVLGVSCTLAQSVPLVEKLVAAVRGDERVRQVKIMVGGLPFMRRADLWSKIGADAQAGDAAEAVQVFRALISREGHDFR